MVLIIFPISIEVHFGHKLWKLKKTHFQIYSSVLQSLTQELSMLLDNFGLYKQLDQNDLFVPYPQF